MLCLQVNCIIYDRFELFFYFSCCKESILLSDSYTVFDTLHFSLCLFSAAYDLPALLHCLWRSRHWHSITLLLALTLLDTAKLSVVLPLLLVTFNVLTCCSTALPFGALSIVILLFSHLRSHCLFMWRSWCFTSVYTQCSHLLSHCWVSIAFIVALLCYSWHLFNLITCTDFRLLYPLPP